MGMKPSVKPCGSGMIQKQLGTAYDVVKEVRDNLDVIKVADYVIDLGPEGGDRGGKIVCTGTPEEVADNKKSYTGEYLKKVL